jgi:tetratricopeptide (TPR) repeat protein
VKKYVVIIIVSFVVISGLVYYIESKDESDEVGAQDFIRQAEEYLDDKQYSKALEQYKQAINADPSNTAVYLSATDIYLLKSKDEEAITLLQNGESSVINADLIHHKIGQILLENGDIEGALTYFEKAQKENPNNWENSIDLVKVYTFYSEREKEMKDVLEGISLNEGEGAVMKFYYLSLISHQDIDASIRYLETAYAKSEGELNTQMKAFLDIMKKVKEDPDDIVTNNSYIGYELLRAELYGLSIPVFEGVISENDEYYAAFMYLGIAHMSMNDQDKAREKLERATTIAPDEIQPWLFLAEVYVQQNNQKLAIESYEQALHVGKDNEDVRYDYAKSLESFGLYRQAHLQYKELIDLESDKTVEYKIELIYIDLDYLEDYEEGLTFAREIVEDWEGFNSADAELQSRALDALGWAYEKNDKKDDALKYLNQSVDVYPYYAPVYFHVGIINSEIGNDIEARINFERAIDLDLDGDTSSLALNELEKLSE